jgi:hypothetical protein
MTAITAYTPVRASAEKRGRSSVHAVAKIRAKANFDGEYAARREPKSWICTPCEPREASHSGTTDDASFWDAPRLKAEFVAQVLGQALVAKAPKASAAAAYGRPLRSAARFDKAV